MKKIIHHMRGQPEEIRRHILHIATGIMGIILFLLWIFSLGRNLSAPERSRAMKENLEPLSALKANIIGGYNSLTE